MTVKIDWSLMQSPNVMADYLQGMQLRNQLARQAPQMAAGQGAAAGDAGADGGGAAGAGGGQPAGDDGLSDGRDWREAASWDLLSGIDALRRYPAGANGDLSARMQAARQMLPALMQRYPGLNPQALQQLDLSDEGLSRAEQFLIGG